MERHKDNGVGRMHSYWGRISVSVVKWASRKINESKTKQEIRLKNKRIARAVQEKDKKRRRAREN